MMARHDDKTSAYRAKMLSRGDTGDRVKGREREGKGKGGKKTPPRYKFLITKLLITD